MKYRLIFCCGILYLAFACSAKKKYNNFVKIEKEKLIKEVVASNKEKLPEEEFSEKTLAPEPSKNSVYDTLPNSFNLRPFLTEAKAQGSRNTCAYFVFCGLLEALYQKKYKKTINFSEEYLIALRQDAFYGADETCSINSVFETYNSYGIVPENSYPYQPIWTDYGFPYHQYRELESIPVNAYKSNKPDTIYTTPDNEENNIMQSNSFVSVLAYLTKRSLPVIGVFILTKDRYDHYDSENGPITKTTFGEIRNIDDKTGEFKFEIPKLYKVVNKDTIFQNNIIEEEWENHFMLITGYDKELKRLYFRNSWVKSFGDEGYGFITFSEFKKRLVDSYRVTPKFILNVFEEDNAKAADINIEGEEVQTNYTKDGGLQILFTGNIETIPNKSLLIEHKIYELEVTDTGLKNDYTKAKVFTLNDENAKMVKDKYIRTYWNALSNKTKKLHIWTNENPLKSKLSKQKMKSFFNQYNPTNSYFVCSTITTCDDVNDTVELRRIWTPIEVKDLVQN